jgi:hypothetical protein
MSDGDDGSHITSGGFRQAQAELVEQWQGQHSTRNSRPQPGAGQPHNTTPNQSKATTVEEKVHKMMMNSRYSCVHCIWIIFF